MNSILKKWWIWVIVILIIAISIFVYLLFKKDSNGIGTAGINKEEFKRISTGMSQFEVDRIIDELNEWDNDEIYEKSCEQISQEYNEHKYTYQYKYYGEKSGYAIITYQADYSNSFFEMPKVIKKENFNLK